MSEWRSIVCNHSRKRDTKLSPVHLSGLTEITIKHNNTKNANNKTHHYKTNRASSLPSESKSIKFFRIVQYNIVGTYDQIVDIV